MHRLFTSESVTSGHPDKVADQISDAILDELIAQDPRSRVAVEVLLTVGTAFVAGEITTSGYADILGITRGVIRDIGYVRPEYGFNWSDLGALTAIHEQSPEIAQKVDPHKVGKGGKIVREDLKKLGAGDQGLMFGYATTETKELMPLPITMAHRLAQRLDQVRRSGVVKKLRPDGKTQVTVLYEDDKPVRVENVVVATQHDPDKSLTSIRREITEAVVNPVLKEFPIESKTVKRYVNATGSFVLGGPQADTGLTGRKIIVDTYGGSARHGGGALSGKDPTKVDRSGQYAARWVAKNIVAAGLASRCEFQLGYVIGQPKPVSVAVETFGTGTVSDEAIAKAVNRVFDLRPGIIIQQLKLRRPIYRQTAAYGHFGRPDLDLPWERTNKVSELKKAVK